jgi:glutaredoxin 3
MARVKIYSTGSCPYCDRAKSFLTKLGIAYDEVRVDLDRAGLKEMLAATNHARTVPQIIVDGRHVGGFMELTELHMDGGLDALLPGKT